MKYPFKYIHIKTSFENLIYKNIDQKIYHLYLPHQSNISSSLSKKNFLQRISDNFQKNIFDTFEINVQKQNSVICIKNFLLFDGNVFKYEKNYIDNILNVRSKYLETSFEIKKYKKYKHNLLKDIIDNL
jgi:hypothetical protein